MASDPEPKFPGQVLQLILSKEQLKEVSSPVRAEVFWSISPFEPMSVTDIASEVGKAPPTIRYHVNALLEMGLLLVAGTRKQRSRTEQLYVRSAIRAIVKNSTDPEYSSMQARAFKLDAMRRIRESAHFYGWLEQHPEAVEFGTQRKYNLRLSKERASRLRTELLQLLRDAAEDQATEDEGGVNVSTFIYMRPTLGQMRTWAEAEGRDLKEFDRGQPPTEPNEG